MGVEAERPLYPSNSGGRQELLVLDEWKTARRRLTTALRKSAEEKAISTSPFVSESDLRLELVRLGLLVEKVENAIALARQVHQEHRRDDGSPYLEEHVFAVALETARYLADRTVDGSPVDAVVVALLHDVLEDRGSARVLDLKKTFGQEVSSIVQLLTKEPASQQNELDSDLEREERYIRRVGSGPPIARVVKVFDRLNNLACLHKSQPSKRARYIEETRRLHLPLAREFDPALAEAIEARLQELSTRLESGK
jgi:(p)ppGpp synthase/HD superfamily hydrolase